MTRVSRSCDCRQKTETERQLRQLSKNMGTNRIRAFMFWEMLPIRVHKSNRSCN